MRVTIHRNGVTHELTGDYFEVRREVARLLDLETAPRFSPLPLYYGPTCSTDAAPKTYVDAKGDSGK